MTEASRIIGHMVTGNELDRYLIGTIEWLRALCDDLFVYDDASTDGTFEYLAAADVPSMQREAGDPSFSENEGVFRMMGWREMEAQCAPTTRDWILCVDADELLLGHEDPCDTRQVLLNEIQAATSATRDAIAFEVAEAFGLDNGRPLIRCDGFWGKIQACRLVRWRNYGVIAPRDAGGSLPAPWMSFDYISLDLSLLHLGYVRHQDRRAKYQRYTNGTGHNPTHVDSIMKPPTLAPWTGQRLPAGIP
jgi:hypothetical protein